MNSTNYSIPFDAFSGGGARSTSTNYIFEDTVSEVSTPTGENLSSTNYAACAGYQCLKQAGFLSVLFAVKSSACVAGDTSTPPFDVDLGTVTTSAVKTSDDHICVTVTANAGGGVTVDVRGTNAALKSVSTPADTIASTTETLAAGDPGFGICSANAANGFTAQSPFNGTCNTTTGHSVGGITTVAQTIYSASSPVNFAFGDILTKAAISGTVPSHNDYAETLTITVTGTY